MLPKTQSDGIIETNIFHFILLYLNLQSKKELHLRETKDI